MNYDKFKWATKIFVKTLLKIGANFLKAHVFKLAMAMILPTSLIEPFQKIISLFFERDNTA